MSVGWDPDVGEELAVGGFEVAVGGLEGLVNEGDDIFD